MIRTGSPTDGFGGGVKIGAKSSPYFATKHTEVNTILDAFGGDGQRMWLGMIQYWNQYNELPTPLLRMTELSENILYTPNFGAYLDYVTPYKLRKPYVKYNLIDSTVGKPGQGGTLVPLVLSAEYANGDILTNDKRNGIQVRVSETVPIKAYGEGDAFVHQVTLASDSVEEWIPLEVFEPGTSWYKIDNRSAEFGIHSSSLTQQGAGLIQQSYKTANSEISVSHSITSRADQFQVNSLSQANVYPGLFNYNDMRSNTQDEIINFYNMGPDGKPIKGSNAWMPTIISKMIEELAMMKEHSLTWSRGFSFTGANSQKVDVPTGYYHQVKERGVYFQYHDLTNILGTLKEMVQQLFAGRKNLKPQDRRVKFTMGFGAFIEAQKAFGEYARATNPFQIVNVGGNNPVTNGIFTGGFQSLKYSQPKVVSVEFPEIGLVEIEHNAALDYMDDDNEFQHYTGQLPNSSYIIWVEDLTSDEFTNAIPKGATPNVAAGKTTITGNVVQLRPLGYEDNISFIPGRGYNPTLNKFLGQGAKSQIAVNHQKGFEVIMDTCGEIFIKDPSRIVLGEYVPKGVTIY